MRIPRLALPLLCLALSPLAQAQNKEALYTKSLAATCANCHGTNGKVVEGSTVTSLAGLDKGYIVAQMNAFKTGTRPATVMHQISKGFNDAQIESLASYFSVQQK
ncbi:c-type cytochrome [Polaromonas sp. JS666]|uniref:c-type cytochrome n=1 Tax=Polaromonas sp. (strain JS666 / ATCC BAA-500) TaxID=296591 RepID=UPI00087EEF6B|nr:c-type cytochrome [Polaromonas sp. JS666]SDO08998.1 Cytochrome c553 [Polaromonas sp. JS666]